MTDSLSTARAPHVIGSRLAESMERETEREFLGQFLSASESYRRPYLLVSDELLANYMVTLPTVRQTTTGYNLRASTTAYRDRAGTHATGLGWSRLKDPETHQIVETIVGQGLGLMFSDREYLAALPIGSDDYEKARLLSRLIMAVLEGPGVYRTLYQTFKDAFIFGTAILECGWKTSVRKQVTFQPVLDLATGAVVGQELVPDDVVYFNGVHLRQVDHYDFYPDPTGTRIQEDMIGCAKRFRVVRHAAEEMTKPGPAGEPPVWDKEATRRAISQQGTARGGQESTEDRRWKYDDKRLPDKYKPMTGFQGWFEVPWKPRDGYRNRQITMLGSEIVQSCINPYIDGRIPLKEIVVNPISGRFYGLSPAEVVRYLQDSADSMLMTTTDLANAAVASPLMVGQTWNGDKNRLRRRDLMDIIEVGDVNQVAPLPVDYNALQYAAAAWQQRKNTAREASGATNPLQAIAGQKEQTATQFSEMVRLASQKVELMVQLMEKDDLPWLGRSIHSRLRQFMPEDGMIATLAGEQFPVSLADIDFEADVRFVGSRHAMSKFQRGAAFDRALTVIASNPQVVMAYPDLFVRYFRDGLDIEDADRIVAYAVRKTQEMQITNAVLEQSLQGGSAAAPGSPVTTPGGAVAREGARVA